MLKKWRITVAKLFASQSSLNSMQTLRQIRKSHVSPETLPGLTMALQVISCICCVHFSTFEMNFASFAASSRTSTILRRTLIVSLKLFKNAFVWNEPDAVLARYESTQQPYRFILLNECTEKS